MAEEDVDQEALDETAQEGQETEEQPDGSEADGQTTPPQEWDPVRQRHDMERAARHRQELAERDTRIQELQEQLDTRQREPDKPTDETLEDFASVDDLKAALDREKSARSDLAGKYDALEKRISDLSGNLEAQQQQAAERAAQEKWDQFKSAKIKDVGPADWNKAGEAAYERLKGMGYYGEDGEGPLPSDAAAQLAIELELAQLGKGAKPSQKAPSQTVDTGRGGAAPTTASEGSLDDVMDSLEERGIVRPG